LKWYDGGGENGITSKKIFFKLKCFSSLRILTSHLFEETLGVFLFLPIFLSFFFSINHDYGDVIVVDISAMDTYSRMEVCTPIFLGEASK
jgi:hypothetical protein